MIRGALALAAVSLVLPAAASASTVALAEDDDGAGPRFAYTAAEGEVNDLTASGGNGSVQLTDPGAEIEPGTGCVPIGPHSVICTTDSENIRVAATLGDEDDRFTGEGPWFDVDGGAGDDVLDGGPAGGRLAGAGGEDTLSAGNSVLMDGGDGADALNAGDGVDELIGGAGPDAIDGGGGGGLGDTVDYRDHTEGVTVDLSTPGSVAGSAGEGDTVTGVENVYGSDEDDDLTATDDPVHPGRSWIVAGGGDDVIVGGPGPDDLDAGPGDDRVEGGASHDLLNGGSGRDTIDGGDAGDYIFSGEPTPEQDAVTCGPGSGAVFAGSASQRALLDVIDQSCGRVDISAPVVREVVHRYPLRPQRSVRVRLGCLDRCRVRIALRAHERLMGSGERELRRGQPGTLTAALSREARDELKRTGVLKLRFSLVVKWGKRLRHRQVTSYYLLLHDPPPAAR